MTAEADRASLIDQLSGYSSPLEIVLGEGRVIRAAEWDYGGASECGVIFFHPESALSVGYDIPTNEEYHELSSLDLSGTYEEVCERIWERAEVDEEWWSNEPGSNSIEGIRKWLRSEIGIEKLECYRPEVSEYLPGFEILAHRPEPLRKKLGMRRADLGGPASHVPAVAVSVTTEELNAVLVSVGLPFRVQLHGDSDRGVAE